MSGGRANTMPSAPGSLVDFSFSQALAREYPMRGWPCAKRHVPQIGF